MKSTHYTVYILLCSNGAYYTGYTNDLERRYREHCLGSAKCKYTRSFKPVKLAQSWKILGEKTEAMKIEKYIKTLNKQQKIALINSPKKLAEQFALSISVKAEKI